MSELQRVPLAYLGTPYTLYRDGIDAAYVEACKIAAELIRSGVRLFSPITHSHGIAIHGKIDPLDHAIWIPFDEAMMDVASVLIVAHMAGWEKSFGIAHEVAFFEKRGRPIYDLNPDTMTMTRRLRKLARDRFDGAGDNDLESDRRGFLENNPLPLKGPSA